MKHVDVRSVHPTLIYGVKGTRLEGAPRGITVEDAELWVERKEEEARRQAEEDREE